VFPRFAPEAVAAHLGLVQAVQQIAARLGATPGQIALARRARTSWQFPGPADSSGSRRTSAPQTSSSRPRISPNSTASPLRTRYRETATPSRCSASSTADRPAANSARWRPASRPPLGVDSFAYGSAHADPSGEDTSSPGQGVNRSRGRPLQRGRRSGTTRSPGRARGSPSSTPRTRYRSTASCPPDGARGSARCRAHLRVTPLHARHRDRDDLPSAGLGGGGNAAGHQRAGGSPGAGCPAARHPVTADRRLCPEVMTYTPPLMAGWAR
jgi:hypothetical protein